MLEKQDFRDNLNYLTLEKRYNIIPSLHLCQLDHKANVVQEFHLNKMTSHKFLDKTLKNFFQDVEEINHYKVNNILFPGKSTIELEIK